ncbi:hypothetical protein [Kitasatospora viridis]|uniref:hypothetical protein n=1 Tax=Kitasatospora viridis TaxID=281105 RepID=UPI001FE5E1F8|nr:hypothetical protein [Kitasatospora viridis]
MENVVERLARKARIVVAGRTVELEQQHPVVPQEFIADGAEQFGRERIGSQVVREPRPNRRRTGPASRAPAWRWRLPSCGLFGSPAAATKGRRPGAEGAPDDTTADYLHKLFKPTARAIDGLERALAGMGLLQDALTLDLRRPQRALSEDMSVSSL